MTINKHRKAAIFSLKWGKYFLIVHITLGDGIIFVITMSIKWTRLMYFTHADLKMQEHRAISDPPAYSLSSFLLLLLSFKIFTDMLSVHFTITVSTLLWVKNSTSSTWKNYSSKNIDKSCDDNKISDCSSCSYRLHFFLVLCMLVTTNQGKCDTCINLFAKGKISFFFMG